MPFNLFHRKKQPEQEEQAPAQREVPLQPSQEISPQPAVVVEEPAQDPLIATVEQPQEVPMPEPTSEQPIEQTAASIVEQQPQAPTEPASKTYLKAMPLKQLSDIDNVKTEVTNGNIIILRITPLASKSIEEVKTAVNELFQFAESTGGDIARLGEERVVICPKSIRIWREKTPAPVTSSEPLSTAA